MDVYLNKVPLSTFHIWDFLAFVTCHGVSRNWTQQTGFQSDDCSSSLYTCRGHICSWCVPTGAICLHESAEYGTKHTVVTWNTVCQYTHTQMNSSSCNAKLHWTYYIWLAEGLGCIIEFHLFEFVSIRPSIQLRSLSISPSKWMHIFLALYYRREESFMLLIMPHCSKWSRRRWLDAYLFPFQLLPFSVT